VYRENHFAYGAPGGQGITAEPPGLPGGADGPRTSWITDPDGYRIELVQWPAGHADGITGADFA
jgi:lactoylglutathione lyase